MHHLRFASMFQSFKVILVVFLLDKGPIISKLYPQMRLILCADSHWHETTLCLSYKRIHAQLNTAIIVSIYNFYHCYVYEVSPS